MRTDSGDGEDTVHRLSVLVGLVLGLLQPSPPLHLLQTVQDLVHSLLVLDLMRQTQSLLIETERLVQTTCWTADMVRDRDRDTPSTPPLL